MTVENREFFEVFSNICLYDETGSFTFRDLTLQREDLSKWDKNSSRSVEQSTQKSPHQKWKYWDKIPNMFLNCFLTILLTSYVILYYHFE